MKIEGKLHAKMDVAQVTQTFRKREFVVEYSDNPMYPQFVKLELVQDNVNLIDSFEVGQMVSVEFNLRGREWKAPDGETKYFNTLAAWRIQPVGGATPQPGADVPDSVYETASMSNDNADDLPF